MDRTIIGTLGLALTVTFATPVFITGVIYLSRGETLTAAAMFGLVALMLIVEEYVTSPTEAPLAAFQRVVGYVAKDPEALDEGDGQGGVATETDDPDGGDGQGGVATGSDDPGSTVEGER